MPEYNWGLFRNRKVCGVGCNFFKYQQCLLHLIYNKYLTGSYVFIFDIQQICLRSYFYGRKEKRKRIGIKGRKKMEILA